MDTLLKLACLVFLIAWVWPILKEGAREIRDALELNAYEQKSREEARLVQLLRPVSEYAQVLENIKQFNWEISIGKGLKDRLSICRNWCYAPEIDMFAPLRYIGVAGANAYFYTDICGVNIRAQDLMTQGETALSEWFTALASDSEALEPLTTKLRLRFPQVRQSKTRLKLYVPKNWIAGVKFDDVSKTDERSCPDDLA